MRNSTVHEKLITSRTQQFLHIVQPEPDKNHSKAALFQWHVLNGKRKIAGNLNIYREYVHGCTVIYIQPPEMPKWSYGTAPRANNPVTSKTEGWF